MASLGSSSANRCRGRKAPGHRTGAESEQLSRHTPQPDEQGRRAAEAGATRTSEDRRETLDRRQAPVKSGHQEDVDKRLPCIKREVVKDENYLFRKRSSGRGDRASSRDLAAETGRRKAGECPERRVRDENSWAPGGDSPPDLAQADDKRADTVRAPPRHRGQVRPCSQAGRSGDPGQQQRAGLLSLSKSASAGRSGHGP